MKRRRNSGGARIKMAETSLLQGKRFYCREWVFHKIQHCLQEKTSGLAGVTGAPGKPAAPASTTTAASNPGTLTAGSAKSAGGSWGVLLVGGPGSGKTALCTELLWPAAARGAQRQSLAFHFCRADDSDTLCVGGFVRGLVAQICRGGLLPGYEEKVRDPAAQSALQPGECERNPTEAFKR
ncbi:Ankyrin repeat domain-containing protein 50 [Liparis tanakae]|uniref:Ankyrin repeat domain-containing protein 50 n=1 Tax=Liparis tanakae TaxID=230148 RepID=A0A4Z2FJ23_9TELE|nr:Ankyrin repeat domain-containing protein 50 [Liparis tanakae]